MKLISMNISGVGGSSKTRYLEDLVRKEQSYVVCLQETKCKELGKEIFFQMWGTNEIDWVERGTDNNAGGVITMWRRSCFHLDNIIIGVIFCIIEGECKVGESRPTTIVNIYSYGFLRERCAIWEAIWEKKRAHMSATWCAVEDFNSIRRSGERRSVKSSHVYRGETRRFNAFIEKSDLFDIPMVGRKFIWYKPNGLVKSKIDRILVSSEWLDKWSDRKQVVLGRSVFEHCALVLKTLTVDWGPKPFRSLDIWQSDGKFKDFVHSKWESYEVQDTGIFVFKENLKLMKANIKV